jgi:hypothetical protein
VNTETDLDNHRTPIVYTVEDRIMARIKHDQSGRGLDVHDNAGAQVFSFLSRTNRAPRRTAICVQAVNGGSVMRIL